LFTHCGGKHRLKTVISALKSLNVKIIAVADIDVLSDEKVFRKIIGALKLNWVTVESRWNIINADANSQRPQLDTTEVKKEVSAILDSVSAINFPPDAAEGIKTVLKHSTAWSKIKQVGKDFFKGGSYTAFTEIDSACKDVGLFIVPVGEVEGFYKPNGNHGPKWVAEVLETVDLKNNKELENARTFVREFIEY
jgi:hypothetical protein